jgi:uncharacterized protein YhaN
MIEWLRTRSEIVDLMVRLAVAERNTAAWQQRESEAKCLVLVELGTLGVSTSSLATQPLHLVIGSAAAVERTHESAAKTRRDLDAAHRKATGAVQRKRKDLEEVEAEWKEWTTAWEAALKVLQFSAKATPETAEAQINAIDDMREAAGRINDLRHERIEKIERDVKTFEAEVAALTLAIAPQLHGTDSEEAVLELDRLAAEATRLRDLKAAKDSDVDGLQEKIDKCRASSREAREIIARLQQTAGAASIEDLRTAIQRSDDRRSLTTELDRLTTALAQDGDGLSVTDLSAECSDSDLDAIAAKEQTVTEEVQELRNRLMEARENRNTARQAFEAIGGDDRAARDAADRQAAFAEITEIAEQYVRLRSARRSLVLGILPATRSNSSSGRNAAASATSRPEMPESPVSAMSASAPPGLGLDLGPDGEHDVPRQRDALQVFPDTGESTVEESTLGLLPKRWRCVTTIGASGRKPTRRAC